MTEWFTERIVDSGRLPLFFLMVAFALTFLFIRFSTRMIRAQVSWWPGNVTPGGLHIHHSVFGIVMMLIAGFLLIALANYETHVTNNILAALFGIGAALVLDEFAMLLHLRDDYWTQEGRESIDAIFVAFAITVLFVLGIHPLGLSGDFARYEEQRTAAVLAMSIGVLAVQYGLAAVTLLKGKVWTGLFGLFIPPLLLIGAIRLSRPAAPWARWRYPPESRKESRAKTREKRFRQPAVRAKIAVEQAVAGKFDLPDPSAAESAARRDEEQR
ncbi:hypothetical protein [Hoyosella altamirensis]|uniref:Heme/copper-type cytochrome/quinol oxidase subunit 4 n=1 Tax=Hoyosella altamirensis TaxID=616997 RepID=A0A839RS18_9ACTN|nr:hypothetical protein [Hoyosella altamirensis]MBB3039137.1 heme/copper-type cytochrome/quinol oxidase subunit 4 [Hoyosella altamirensis]